MVRTNPHNLTPEQEALIDNFVQIVVATGESFSYWARNAITKDGEHLFGQDRGPGSLYKYCKDTKYKNKKSCLEKFRKGNIVTTSWIPLTRAKSDPTLWLQEQPPIRKLTDKEFQFQSQTEFQEQRTMPRHRSYTPVRNKRDER